MKYMQLHVVTYLFPRMNLGLMLYYVHENFAIFTF
jgi:hypothetical protein